MKKTKYILLIFLISIVTGCTAKYDIKIGKDFIDEYSSIQNDDKNSWNDQNFLNGDSYAERIDELMKLPRASYINADDNFYDEFNKTEGVEYYEQKLISSNNIYGIMYKYSFPLDEYYNSTNANICYDEVLVENNDKIFNISTSNSFNCFNNFSKLDKVEVNITTSWDYKVINSNADKEENGKYTWIITRENASNKPIEIELKKVINWRLILIITVPIIAAIVIIYFILKRKMIKNNQI